MSNAIYAALGRQQGLMQEMQVVSNNLANSSTTGFKSDRAVFAEFLVATGPQSPSLSMGGLAGHSFELSQSSVKVTGGKLDLALQGDGYFVIQTDQGERLTRAGHFQISQDGALVDANGNGVVGAGGGPIQLPEDATSIAISSDGTLSANGELIDQVSIVIPTGEMTRGAGTYFTVANGYQDAEMATVIQGALEQSNVSPVLEVSRMIEVQRAYEAGQALLEREDKRLTQAITTLRDR